MYLFHCLSQQSSLKEEKKSSRRHREAKLEELKKSLKDLKKELQKSSNEDEEFAQISRKGIVNLDIAPPRSCLKSKNIDSSPNKASKINNLNSKSHTSKNVTFGEKDEVKVIDC